MTIDNVTQSYYEISVPLEAPRKALVTTTLIFQATAIIAADVAIAWFVSQLISMPHVPQGFILAGTVIVFLLFSFPLLRGAYLNSEREVRQLHLEEMTAYDVDVLAPVLQHAGLHVLNTLELIHGGTVHGLTEANEMVLVALRNATIFVQR